MSDQNSNSIHELNSIDQPIAALASANGRAGVAIIRVSGQNCHEILRPFLVSEKLNSGLERVMQLTLFRDAEGITVDELLVCFFKGPRSFTGQDSIEIFCHGGPHIIDRILQVLYSHGIRAAEPGEFTKRSFLLGKMDLSQAEAIHELVEAHSEQQLQSARYFAEGHFGKFISSLRKDLIGAMSYLAARIDFPDEGDTQDLGLSDVYERVDSVSQHVNQLLATYNSGRIARSGLKLALLGAPNAGKSTLMNALLGQQRAIVTNVPGTTRDYLEEPCLIKGRLMNLIDTAGIRDSEEEVEKLGIERSLEIARQADLILVMVSADSDQEGFQDAAKWVETFGRAKCLCIQSKIDLMPEVKDRGNQWHFLSCKTGQGLDELQAILTTLFDKRVETLTNRPFISKSRHFEILQNCRKHLDSFYQAAKEGFYDEILSFELQEAAKSLNLLIGDIGSEDILDAVFGEFCLGK